MRQDVRIELERPREDSDPSFPNPRTTFIGGHCRFDTHVRSRGHLERPEEDGGIFSEKHQPYGKTTPGGITLDTRRLPAGGGRICASRRQTRAKTGGPSPRDCVPRGSEIFSSHTTLGSRLRRTLGLGASHIGQSRRYSRGKSVTNLPGQGVSPPSDKREERRGQKKRAKCYNARSFAKMGYDTLDGLPCPALRHKKKFSTFF